MVSSLVELCQMGTGISGIKLLWFLAAGNTLNVIHNAPYLFPLWLETFDCSDLIFT